MRRERPGVDVAKILGMGESEQLLVVEKLFLANDKPVILAFNHIPMGLIVRPFVEDDLHIPVFQFLRDFGRRGLSYYVSEIVPALASATLSKSLDMPTGTALISFEETGYDEENQPIILARSFFRDDLLRFRLIRREVI